MMRRCAGFVALFAFILGVANGQKVDPGNFGERLLAIVPMTGTGSGKDPKRPQFVPPTSQAANQAGIVAFRYEVSDDGQWALVELVARDRTAFKQLLESRIPGLKVFERGKDTQAVIEAEFRRLKVNFRTNEFPVVAR